MRPCASPVARRPRVLPSKELVVVRGGACLEQAPRAPAEVGEVDAARLRLLGETLREIERLLDDRRAADRVVAHVVEDRALGTRGDDRVGNPFDPDPRATPVAALALPERLERVDLVRPCVLAEAEEDHPRRFCHEVIIPGHTPDAPRPERQGLTLVVPTPCQRTHSGAAEEPRLERQGLTLVVTRASQSARRAAVPEPQAPRAAASTSTTRSWSSGSICVKNGSAIVRAAVASATGQSPSVNPKRSRM